MKQTLSRATPAQWWQKNRVSCLVLAAALVLFIVVRAIAVPEEDNGSQAAEYAEYENGVITAVLTDNTFTDPAADNALRGEQLLLAEVRTGQYKGETLQVYGYVGPLYGGQLKVGDGVTLLISTYADGTHTATVYEYNRLPVLMVIVALFLIATVAVGGKVGAKSLVALAITLVCLFWILIPLLMKGAPTLLTVFLVCAYITVVTMVILGGVQRKTVCATLGTIAGTALSLLFGLAAQSLARVDGLRLADVEPDRYAAGPAGSAGGRHRHQRAGRGDGRCHEYRLCPDGGACRRSGSGCQRAVPFRHEHRPRYGGHHDQYADPGLSGQRLCPDHLPLFAGPEPLSAHQLGLPDHRGGQQHLQQHRRDPVGAADGAHQLGDPDKGKGVTAPACIMERKQVFPGQWLGNTCFQKEKRSW